MTLQRTVCSECDKFISMRSKVLSILMLPFLMGSTIELEAAQGWVLGSFSEYERAVDEAARLNHALQTEIKIIPAETGGRQLLRLVAPVLSGVDSQDFK